MNTSDTLNRAADLIEERGWSQGNGWILSSAPTDATLCLEGGIQAATGRMGIHHCPAYKAVVDYLNTTRPADINPTLGYVIPWSWNDQPTRTASEVIEVLRACAAIEQARESDVARHYGYSDEVKSC
jgi:hypothetical protein